MSEVRKPFGIAILAIDIIMVVSKHLSLILVVLAAVTFFFAGSALAEGNLLVGVLDLALGTGNIILLMQVRHRINRSTEFDKAHNESQIRAGAYD